MNKLRISAVCAVASALLAGCSGGGSNGIPKITSVNPIQTGKLQFAVGTANIYGTAVGLNVVSTYRQSNGLSNVTVDTPSITGPFKLPAAAPAGNFRVDPNTGVSIDPYSTLTDPSSGEPAGPSAQEVAVGGEIIGTSQTVHPGTPACDKALPCTVPNPAGGTVTIPPNTSTFGQAGGVFVNGISPGNYNNQSVPISFVPYTEPLYDVTANAFTPFGGPPAFENSNGNGLGLRDGLSNLGAGVLGIPLGISTFEGVTVSSGSYKLGVQVPTGFSGQTPTFVNVNATANLASTALLGPIAAAPTLVLDNQGGGTFVVPPFPNGVTEELVQIVDFGDFGTVSCQGAIGASEGAGPVYYTILAKVGINTLPDTIGPNTTVNGGITQITPSPSICTAAQNTAAAGATTQADAYTVQVIGADYPLYESLYPNSKSQTPTIVGANGQSDITISPALSVGFPVGSSSHSRRVQGFKGIKHV